MHRILVLCGLIWLIVSLALPAIGCQQQAIEAPTPAPAQSQTHIRAPEPTPIPLQEPQPEKKTVEVELKYDYGKVSNVMSSCGGYLVDFMPPATPFTITEVRMMGGVFGEQTRDNFEISIWNKDKEVIYKDELPVTMFTSGSLGEVKVDIPNVEIDGKFFVHVFTGTCRLQGISIAADDSVFNKHSTLTSRTFEGDKEQQEWHYPSDLWSGDKSKINWMIRVVGTY